MRDGYQASFFALKVHWAYRWGGHWTFGASRDGGLSVYIHVKPFGTLRPRYERAVIGGRAATIFSIPAAATGLLRGARRGGVEPTWHDLRRDRAWTRLAASRHRHGARADE